MSSNALRTSNPAWFEELLGVEFPSDKNTFIAHNKEYVLQNGIIREKVLASDAQEQTKETFGFKWKKRDTFESEASLSRMKEWLIERYGDMKETPWWSEYSSPVVVDAGCGAGMSGLELFSDILDDIRYVGADISEAIDVASDRFRERGKDVAFIQADITDLPLRDSSVDVIFSEGVLHHTDSTENALKKLAAKLRPGGRFMLYVYKKKGPIREFTDDYIRNKLSDIPPEQAWEKMSSLTKLGALLGELDITIDIPEDIELLEIPAGEINLQRLFYWHVFKAFYREDHNLDEMNHINFDWYAPMNAHRQTPEEVRQWCEEVGMTIEREVVESAGITIIAKKNAN